MMFAWVGAIAAGLLIIISRSTATIIKPGELSTPHAQILAGTLTSQRCASCHPQATRSPRGWFQAGLEGHAGINQSDRCMDCHHATISRASAKFAHNLAPQARAELRLAAATSGDQSWHDLLPSAAVDQENVQCSACHREHRGAEGDLLAVSNTQCQSCHADRFGSFAKSHPEWDRWPYGRGGQVTFNHATHANKHFPATIRGNGVAQFQCADCHARTVNNELTRSTSYARACKSCHDDALRVEAAEGVELLALPMLPPESAGRVQPWPESATGLYDGKLSPLAGLLLRADPQAADALRSLPGGDFSRIDGRNQDSVSAGEIVARAHRQLLQEIGIDGQQVVIDRASLLGVASATLESMVQSLSPQLVMEASRRWFDTESGSGGPAGRQVELWEFSKRRDAFSLVGQRRAEPTPKDEDLLLMSDDDDVLLDDLTSSNGALLGGDSLLGTEGGLLNSDLLDQDSHSQVLLGGIADSSTGEGKRFNADRMLPAGGWYRDDLRLAIRYRAGGHDDPVLKSTIEMISQLPPGDPARQQLLQTRAVDACVACHPGAVSSSGGWRSEPLIGRKSEFTRFAHSPHLNIAQLADCRHCHSIGADSGAGLNLTRGVAVRHDFAPLRRQACAGCHMPHAAGEACVKCHRYHIDLR